MKMRWTMRSTWAVVAVGAVVILAPACGKETARTAAPSGTSLSDTTKLAAAQRGREAYLGSCAMCHGVWGEGDGPMALQVETQGKVPPAALNDPILLDKVGRDELIKIITRGGARSHRSNLMPSWGEKLAPEVIAEIADYVMDLPRLKPGISRTTVEQYIQAPPGTADDGRKIFVFYCTMCHGPQGEGNGLLADSLWAKHQIRPRNLTDSLYFAGKSDKEIYMTVSLGGDYTGHSEFMPGWGGVKLSPGDMKDVVSYVRAISRTQPRP